MRKYISLIIALILVLSCSIVVASAADYTFKAKDNDDFYRSTLYADMYGSEYNYGGQNVTDFYDASKLPGQRDAAPNFPGTVGSYDVPSNNSSDFTSYTTPWETAVTSINDLKRSDGSIGTLYIPSLSISRKVYEGTSTQSMDKGVGHFPESSGWNGNVCVAGHNRGSAYAIGSIKDLKIGDIIEYSTVLGTRRYSVTFVGTISSTDWSFTSPTSDNRITIITCLADQPALRICVQAVQY